MQMLFYDVEMRPDSFGGGYLVTVEDGSIEPFTVSIMELPERALHSETAFHGYVQGLIAVRLQVRKADPARLPAGRHDRGWPH